MSLQLDVYNKLKMAIIYGELSPGERLPESEIAKKLKSSRTPVREALLQLQMEGYVTMLPNKGAYVTKLATKQLEEIYDVICALEGSAGELATPKMTRTELNEIKGIQKKLVTYVAKKSYQEYVLTNTELHQMITRLGDNGTLLKMNMDLRQQVYRYRWITVTIPGYLELYLADHERIIEAMAIKDPILAGNCIRDHVKRVKEALIQFLKSGL